ncbi:MAG: hypothetical protein E6Z10_07605 [Ruminococcus sp.]|nr:hypothetical protein [Ruminococcus sp.]
MEIIKIDQLQTEGHDIAGLVSTQFVDFSIIILFFIFIVLKDEGRKTMSLKKYNVKENYNHAGTRKIPFYKMDEAELVEALTPEESGKLERVTFWEFNDIRKHPGVKETVCIEESYIYSFKFKCGREESIKICPVEDITLPPMTGEEIMEYNGGGMSWGNYDRVVHSDDVKEVKKLLTKKLDFCEKWQQERYRKYEAILKDGRVSTFTVND